MDLDFFAVVKTILIHAVLREHVFECASCLPSSCDDAQKMSPGCVVSMWRTRCDHVAAISSVPTTVIVYLPIHIFNGPPLHTKNAYLNHLHTIRSNNRSGKVRISILHSSCCQFRFSHVLSSFVAFHSRRLSKKLNEWVLALTLTQKCAALYYPPHGHLLCAHLFVVIFKATHLSIDY